jgi:hypothetical protein
VESEAEFRAFCVDRPLRGDGLSFVLGSDGTITGTVDQAALTGSWHWDGELFVRTAALDGLDLGTDSEVIERRGNLMRYTRDAGRGAASTVDVL